MPASPSSLHRFRFVASLTVLVVASAMGGAALGIRAAGTDRPASAPTAPTASAATPAPVSAPAGETPAAPHAKRIGSSSVFGTALAAPPPAVSAQLPDLVEKILPGVVNISSTSVIQQVPQGMEDFFLFWGVPRERKQTSLGSGFIIDKEGYVLTNYHVVEHATEVLATLLDKRQLRAKIIGKDPKMDLALLQLRTTERALPPDLTPVALGDSDAIRIAESVFAVGNPFGLQHTVTVGIISAKNRTIGQGPFDNYLQTDASINPGNSGGPLFNMKGEVIGINTVIYSRTGQSGGLGFAIPSNEAKRLIPDFKRYGRIPRPWLGIVSERMTPQLEAYYNLPTAQGVLVYNLVEGSPAEQAGLRQGDIITGVDGVETHEPNDIEKALAKRKPTDVAKLKVKRARRTLEITVHLQEQPRTLENLPPGII